jgi:hypothetical protein
MNKKQVIREKVRTPATQVYSFAFTMYYAYVIKSIEHNFYYKGHCEYLGSANFYFESSRFTRLRTAFVFFYLMQHNVEPMAFISISLHFDRCNPPERIPFEYKCTVPVVVRDDRYSELFHCRRGNLADNSCCTQVK